MPETIAFDTPAAFRRWLEEHGTTADELVVRFWKKHTGRPSLTWPESVDVALCFGWIDGIRRRVDDERYTIRFTPRRPGSSWSARNLARMEELRREGLVTPAGEAAWAERVPAKERAYSYERHRDAALTPAQRAELEADPEAAAFFDALPPGHRRRLLAWLAAARREETRARRFAQLLAACAEGRRLF